MSKHSSTGFGMIAMNSQSTPTTVIDGEVIIGFARQEIDIKLGLYSTQT